jgi:hypothetical protein
MREPQRLESAQYGNAYRIKLQACDFLGERDGGRHDSPNRCPLRTRAPLSSSRLEANVNPISRVTASHGHRKLRFSDTPATAALDATTSHARYDCGGSEFANYTGDFDPSASAYHKMSGTSAFRGRRV